VPKSGDYAVYRVLSKPGETLRPLDVSLEGGLRLTGYQVFVSQDQPRGSGQRIGIYLYWKTEQAIADRLKVFVHLVNDKGELIGQDDSEPQVWFYPTNEWKPGETVLDFHAVPLKGTATGKLAIRVGLYNDDTGQRLRVFDAGGATVVENAVVLEAK
jgi:mannosyltransferase